MRLGSCGLIPMTPWSVFPIMLMPRLYKSPEDINGTLPHGLAVEPSRGIHIEVLPIRHRLPSLPVPSSASFGAQISPPCAPHEVPGELWIFTCANCRLTVSAEGVFLRIMIATVFTVHAAGVVMSASGPDVSVTWVASTMEAIT